MRYKVKGNADNFAELKKLSAEFGKVAVVNEKRHALSVEASGFKAAILAAHVEKSGGTMTKEIQF